MWMLVKYSEGTWKSEKPGSVNVETTECVPVKVHMQAEQY